MQLMKSFVMLGTCKLYLLGETLLGFATFSKLSMGLFNGSIYHHEVYPQQPQHKRIIVATTQL